MNYLLAVIGAGFVGICVALEPTVNSGLGKYITPRLATFHSFLIGLLAITAINLFKGGFGGYRQINKAPPYFWFGGLIGLCVVYIGAKVAPVIGIAATVTIMVAVQLITGIIIDSLGLFGVTRVPLDFKRILGAVIMILAVRLIIR